MNEDIIQDAYEAGRSLGSTWADALALATARMRGFIDSTNEKAAQAEARRRAGADAEMADAPEDDGPEPNPYAYPMSQTFNSSIINTNIGRVIFVPTDLYGRFPVGMPITVYGPNPERTEDIIPPVRVKAGTVYHRKTAIFVDEDLIPPGSMVEVRLVGTP